MSLSPVRFATEPCLSSPPERIQRKMRKVREEREKERKQKYI
jgi:hypothetical protein